MKKFLMSLFLLAVAGRVDASSVTMFYVGSVEVTFNQAVVPLGSPATILLTFDPAANISATVPGHPDNAGAYSFAAVVSFLDRSWLLRGVLEVNWDARYHYPIPGLIHELLWPPDGPTLVDRTPTFPPSISWTPYLACGSLCSTIIGTTDPNSPDFPALPTLSFDLSFFGDCALPTCPGGGTLRVSGVDPPFQGLEHVASVPVPEPATLALVALGVMFLRRKP